jgi:hypothetical protein
MIYNFRSTYPKLIITTDSSGLTIRAQFETKKILWAEIFGVGLTERQNTQMPIDLPEIFPGFKFLTKFTQNLNNTTQNILIAYRKNGGRKRIYNIKVPLQGEIREQFIAECKQNVGNKFLPEVLPYFELRSKLGFSNWWVVPVTCVMLYLMLMVILFACGGVYLLFKN